MAEEIQQAVQIIRVAYDGIEIAMKIGSGSMKFMKKAMDFLTAVLDHEKALGKTEMKKLLVKGGDLQVLQFDVQDMSKVKRMAKKYGMLYTVLPKMNKKDKTREIIFHTEAVPRANMMLQKLKAGRIATFEDYLKNADEKELEKLISFLKNQKRGNDDLHTEEATRTGEALEGLIEKIGIYAVGQKELGVEEIKKEFNMPSEQAEYMVVQLEKLGVLDKENEGGRHKVLMDKETFLARWKGYRELAARMQTVSLAQDKNLVDITITKQLIKEENDHAVKTRIPGRWGSNEAYLWIDKTNIMDIHDGKTILTFLDCQKDYKLYSADNRVIGTMKGMNLYEEHYDIVETEIVKRYAGTERKADARARKKNPANKKR